MNRKGFGTWISLSLFLVICLSIEIIGGIFTRSSLDSWYLGLEKPFFNPPSWVFGPVWTILYIFIAIAGWKVEKSSFSKEKTKALRIYGIQLLFNLIWSFFFFYLKNPFLAVLDLVVLFCFIVWTVCSFWKLSRIAALLLLPYLAWTGFALILNTAIFVLN